MKRVITRQVIATLCFAGMFLIVLAPCIIYTIQNYTPATVIYHLVFKMSIMFIILCGALLLFRPWLVFGVFSLFFLIEVPFESVHLIILDRYYSFDAIVATLNSNSVEMRQFSSVLLPYYFLAGFLLLLYYVLFFVSGSAKLPLLNRKLVALWGGVSLVVFSLIFATYARYDPYVGSRGEIQSKVVFYWYVLGEYPLNFYDKIREYVKVREHRRELEKGRVGFSFECERPVSPDQPEVYVLVIGEGIRYANWHLNGYARATSPMLDTTEHLLSFRRACSTGVYTAAGVPLLLSRGTPADFDRSYREKTVVSLFKQAGFTTYWISNQDIFGYIVDPTEIENMNNLAHEGMSDLIVLPAFEQVLADTTHRKKFIVVNLLGNHTWAGSFPQSFVRFTPALEYDHKRVLSSANKEYFINRYDNVVLLQDYVLGTMIQRLNVNGSRSFLLFASDHGLSLFEDGGNLFGYSGKKVTDSQVHIPLFIWASDAWRGAHPEKWSMLKARRHEACGTTNVFHTLGDMADIEGGYLFPARSLCNERFQPDSVRSVFFEGKVNVLGSAASVGIP